MRAMDFITSGLSGIGLGNVIILIISLVLHEFIPVDPSFARLFDNQLTAITIQMAAMWLTGNFWLVTNKIYKKPWPMKKRTMIHFFVGLVGMFLICYPLWWIPHDLVGILESVGIYAIVYAVVWFAALKKRA